MIPTGRTVVSSPSAATPTDSDPRPTKAPLTPDFALSTAPASPAASGSAAASASRPSPASSGRSPAGLRRQSQYCPSRTPRLPPPRTASLSPAHHLLQPVPPAAQARRTIRATATATRRTASTAAQRCPRAMSATRAATSRCRAFPACRPRRRRLCLSLLVLSMASGDLARLSHGLRL